MKKIIKNLSAFLFFCILCICLMLYPANCLVYSLTGLNLWFQKMIPALFPFMVLSGIMIRMNLTSKFSSFLKPLFYPLFKINNDGLFAIVAGFLFGFPMGARIIADLYGRNRLSKSEASYLLTFCNNIGPIYFLSFVLPTIRLQAVLPYLIGMYGLPFAYGILLRRTLYKNQITASDNCKPSGHTAPAVKAVGFLQALDDSIVSGLDGISKLGGYMIFFNLLNILPNILLPGLKYAAIINALLEITSGINIMGDSNPLAVLLILPFGGLSCIAQTYGVIKETDLSISQYVLHKLILTGLTGIYYIILLSRFSPA